MTTIADIRARLRKDLHDPPFAPRLSKGADYRWTSFVTLIPSNFPLP